jgi:plastocyanin
LEKIMRKTMLLLALLSLAATTACGGGNDGIPNLPNLPDGPGRGGPTEALTATVKGKIAFTGAVPAPKTLSASSDPACMIAGVPDESVVVSDGGLENVILYVSKGHEGKSFEQLTTSVTLDQKGCQYRPHALTLQTKQTLKITNSDETAHNVHAFPNLNPQFNVPQPQKGAVTEKVFDKEEMNFPIRCDVHNWMQTFVGVFAHPLHTVSKSGGAFEMKLPPGTYTITALHEKLGEKTAEVTVTDGTPAELNFQF